ncbi:peptidyl-prolyl cis-trans isomerase [Hamiltosporidium tvaerminnensis]|uniref:Peptidyl-prolyl cis-trans isomerase n=1 Tax=Hamiltosporidium tvaerminnensis TaxID=1176355 RepID=A0A4Q9LR37_9MICR|nr:peptidyl-prolyl cis-trans isomerase [Hamiltosporidium tvaerminnensis]
MVMLLIFFTILKFIRNLKKEEMIFNKRNDIYMDISYVNIESKERVTERIIIKLYYDDVPRTCLNFYKFVEGFEVEEEDGKIKNLRYLNSTFHRIIKDFVIQGGDVVRHDGRGSISIYGKQFEDENFMYKHDRVGLLSMANHGPDTNGCQYFITLGKAEWLDGKHVVFGEVLGEYLDVIKRISMVETRGRDNRPTSMVSVVGCGFIKKSGKDEL